jgi:Secretion system C-terminal sorting domain
MKHFIVFIAFSCLFNPWVFSQDFRGIEFNLGIQPNDTFGNKRLTVHIYYKSMDTVQMDTLRRVHCFWWNDMPKTHHYFYPDNIQMLQFEDDDYISSGFNDCVTDTFFLEGVNNYNDGKLTPIQFSTSFFTLSSYDVDATLNTKLNDGYFANGVFQFDASAGDPNGENVAYYLMNNFDFGEYEQYYSTPIGTDTLRLDTITGEMRWDRPTIPGKYLVYFGYSTSFAPVPSWYSVEMKRYMIIEVKPEDIVSATFNPKSENEIMVGPNPAKGKLDVILEPSNSCLEGKLIIYNIFGQKMYYEPVQLYQNKIKSEIDISNLNAGVYFLIYESCNRIIKSKKIIVN